MDDATRLEITNWLMARGLAGAGETDIVAGVCDRLVAAGVPLHRVALAHRTLHPATAGHEVEWWRDGAAAQKIPWAHGDYDEAQLTGRPFWEMYRRGDSRLRIALTDEGAPLPYALLTRLKAAGATDYFALEADFGAVEREGPFAGFYTSWTADRPDGFADADIAAIEAVLPPMALAIKATATHRIAKTIATAYLGRDAGARVLDGRIQRGDVDRVEAALIYADMIGFTAIADAHDGPDVVAMLTDYFDPVVAAVEAHGGEVLKFMGDGILAMVPLGEAPHRACAGAIAAVDDALAASACVSARRRKTGLPASGFRVALHVGEMMYGNIGGQDRLDFTAIGPAVNETARMLARAGALDRAVVVSAAFAALADVAAERFVPLGPHWLRGVGRPVDLYALTAGAEEVRAAAC